MYKAIVFAGTTEGYEISRFLSENKVSVLACVATEYGSRSLEENEFLSIRAERLDKEQMQELFAAERPELVLDATHPYAAEVTVNIREACENTAVSYVRVLREGGVHKDAVYVENTEAAVDYLKHVSGNVLLTIECWQEVHPGLVSLPVNWDYSIPYGLLYSLHAPEDVLRFVKTVGDITNMM